MPSNLNIKYGTKTGTGNTLKSSNNPNVTPGNIYAAENSAGEIEVYIDTPKNSGSQRKRLDPRIYVGGTPTGGASTVWNNYDVWIDTSGDPTGIATTTTDGLMSSTNVIDINTLKTNMTTAQSDISTIKNKINDLIDALQGLNIAIKKGPWNNDMGASNTLTIVMPSDWAGTDITFNPDGNVAEFTTGGSGS